MAFEYKTKVRVSVPILEQQVEILKGEYEAFDPNGVLRLIKDKSDARGHNARSLFSRWNNMKHFLLRLKQLDKAGENHPILKKYDDESVLIEVVGSAKGNSARVYFKPSITSLDKSVRKAILPIQDGNVFVYADIKAAEFALRCTQAQEQEALNAYQRGEDIYMFFKDLFPAEFQNNRPVIKTILIANMYGKSAYSTAKDLGCSEAFAQRLLDSIAQRTPRMTMLKRRIAMYAQRNNGYFSPLGFDQSNLVKVASINKDKGFDPNMAWSAYTQSALGFIMQSFTTNYLKHQKECEQTTLSVFDSIFFEIKPESLERFKEFANKYWAPLQFEDFTTGKSMYEAAYE